MSAQILDTVEKATLDASETGLTITLTGDFTDACRAYLARPHRICLNCGAIAGSPGGIYACNDGGLVGPHRWADEPAATRLMFRLPWEAARELGRSYEEAVG